MSYQIRTATRADQSRLERLIASSARSLGASDYRTEQIEAALHGAFGVDTQLIDDGMCFLAAVDEEIVGCGGWSRRRTLFGGDSHAERDNGVLDSTVDAAKICVFFVAPAHTRQRVARALLRRCEVRSARKVS